MKWSLRYYNELDHEFHERINNAEKMLSEYTSLFKFKLADNCTIVSIFTKFRIYCTCILLYCK